MAVGMPHCYRGLFFASAAGMFAGLVVCGALWTEPGRRLTRRRCATTAAYTSALPPIAAQFDRPKNRPRRRQRYINTGVAYPVRFFFFASTARMVAGLVVCRALWAEPGRRLTRRRCAMTAAYASALPPIAAQFDRPKTDRVVASAISIRASHIVFAFYGALLRLHAPDESRDTHGTSAHVGYASPWPARHDPDRIARLAA